MANTSNGAEKQQRLNCTTHAESNDLEIQPSAKRLCRFIERELPIYDKNAIDESLVKSIVHGFQPLTIVEESDFKKFVHALNPAYELPAMDSIATFLLPALYGKQREYLVNFVKENAESVCFTVDCWAYGVDQFMGVTAHFFSKDLEMKSVFLQCYMLDGSFTFTVEIAKKLQTVIDTWGMSDILVFLVTNEIETSNLCSVSDILSGGFFQNWDHYGCFERKLNNIVVHALNSVKNLIEKVTKMVTYLKNNSTALSQLVDHQMRQSNRDTKMVIKAVPNNWSSIYLMLERFHFLKEAIQATMAKQDGICLPLISDGEWNCIEQICVILQPFHELKNAMKEENYLTGSTSMVLTSNLMTICNDLLTRTDFNTPVVDLLKKLNNGVIDRLGNIPYNVRVAMCSLLDPRYKDVVFTYKLSLDHTKEHVLYLMESFITEDDTQAGKEEKARLKSGVDNRYSIWGLLDRTLQAPRTPKAKAHDELNMFLMENIIDRKLCPLTWWRNNKSIYPVLYKIFKSKCNIVVTSVPYNREYMKAEYMYNLVDNDALQQIIFLNANKLFYN